MPLESATATKKSSTKGRHIKQINPLAKGKSCLTCRQRKVRCTAERPACQACLRTARYEGRDVKTIQCTYEDSKVVRSRKGKGKGTAAAQGGSSTADEDEQTRKKNIKGTMADLLNGESGGTHRSLTRNLDRGAVPHPSRNNSWNSDWDPVEPAGGIRAFPPTHDYTSTPTLSYSSASSPSDTAVSCPPSPSTASMPIPSMQSLPSTSFSPYPFRLPPMYAQPPPAMTSTPLPYPTLPQPSIDYSSYFATLRPPTFDQLPIPPRQPSKPSPIPSPGARYLSESFNFPFDQSAPQPTPNFPSLYDRAPTLSNESSFSPYSLSYTPNPYVVQSPTTFGDMSSMFPSLTLPPIQVPLPTPAPVPDPSASLDPSQSQKAFGGSIASPSDLESWLIRLAP
ncbi:hypothetical protein JCM16303_005479 [Sporobolomyces ruberrimus]